MLNDKECLSENSSSIQTKLKPPRLVSSLFARQHGFSLLEILVAFAILSMSLGVLFAIFGKGMDLAGTSDEYTKAVLLAESTLARVGVEKRLQQGENYGSIDDVYDWRVTVETFTPYDEELLVENLPFQLFQVNVEVKWGGIGFSRSVELKTLRFGPAEDTF